MTSISMPPALPGSMAGHNHSLPIDVNSLPTSLSGSPHRRRPSRKPDLPPLPAFSFNPGAMASPDPETDVASSPTHPILQEMAARQEPRKIARPPPLPAFSFNPGADVKAESSPSPTHPILEEMAQNQLRRSVRPTSLMEVTLPHTPTDLQPSPSPTRSSFGDGTFPGRGVGHRRNGSEFVGGGSDGTHLTSATMISTSPNKTEHHLKHNGPPVTAPVRGSHRHRRSEAISISDIDVSDLIKANAVAKHRAGSAPATPSDINEPSFFGNESSPRISQSFSIINTPPPPSSPRRRRESAPGVRPRVGFSDVVDVIPRPLSLISSETEGSNSTIRGTHSLTGSVNSFATASPPPQPTPSITFNKDVGNQTQRPRTADGVSSSSSSPGKTESLSDGGSILKRPLSASGPLGNSPTGEGPLGKKRHFWFTHSNENSPKGTPRTERADPMSFLPSFAPLDSSPVTRPKTSPERQASIKKRKVRTWTGHLFSRKGRSVATKSKAKRTPTPPLSRQPSDRLKEIFDADDTIVIRNSVPPVEEKKAVVKPEVALQTPDTSVSSAYQPASEESITSPVLDLDAAFASFDSETRLAIDEAVPRGAASKISRLHSSERRGPIDAFGTFHRRAESAPQMVPVNRNSFGIHHLGSSASIANDVFDEEEEDDFLAHEKESSQMIDASLKDTPSNQAADDAATKRSQEVEDSSVVVISDPEQSISPQGLGFSVAHDLDDRVAIVDSEGELERGPGRLSSSTIIAPILADGDLPKRPASSPMEFLYGATQTSYASSTEGRTAPNSVISSPDAEHVSFDNQPRSNRYAGEPNLDVILRSSNDDLPSLTDSVSTGVIPRISSSAGTRSSTEQRAASYSGTPQTKTHPAWKRASLASLNKLIPGSANGSKLRFEESAVSAEDEKAKKKGNRISRLVYFWRSKEKA